MYSFSIAFIELWFRKNPIFAEERNKKTGELKEKEATIKKLNSAIEFMGRMLGDAHINVILRPYCLKEMKKFFMEDFGFLENMTTIIH